jgi:hypothetical protein
MKVSELREILRDIPGDYEVVIPTSSGKRTSSLFTPNISTEECHYTAIDENIGFLNGSQPITKGIAMFPFDFTGNYLP